MKLRTAVRDAGLDGFQWVGGSFVEDLVEREPKDIDVVTFYTLPPGQTQKDLVKKHANLFDLRRNKAEFGCDAYFVELGQAPARLVRRAAYWYGLFSHKRGTFEWKGFVQLPLDGTQDTEALGAVQVSE